MGLGINYFLILSDVIIDIAHIKLWLPPAIKTHLSDRKLFTSKPKYLR